MVWGDYHVLALGQDYDYAMVGSPNRSYLWMLSRTPTMDSQVRATCEAGWCRAGDGEEVTVDGTCGEVTR